MRNRTAALSVVLAASAPLYASGVPVGIGESRAETPSPQGFPLGVRALKLGDSGTGVKTLNWALRAESLGTPYSDSFSDRTDVAVRTVQSAVGLPADGVVGTGATGDARG